jgi:hypothetical protein
MVAKNLPMKYPYLFTRNVQRGLKSGGAADPSVSDPTINPQEAPNNTGKPEKTHGITGGRGKEVLPRVPL